MKISTNWINDLIDIKDLDKKQLADSITNAGVNVEKVKQYVFNNLVIGHVLDVWDHPASDHLHICKVNDGNNIRQIVCGAPNVAKDQKVIVALEGAVLPGDFLIEKRVVRGEESNGMICSEKELGLGEDSDGILVLGEDAVAGKDPIEYLGLDDIVYELDLNPNRNDCLSHVGFAYEVGANIKRKVTLPIDKTNDIKESIKDNFALEVETENCTMYEARMVRNVKIGSSPDFIKNRLEACGMRSINNVVDISNYVMLEYGQPLHFFDKDKLGNKIVVRMAKDNESVTTLDEEKRILSNEDIVITDGKDIVAIAGVMGALNTDVDNNTKDILIESAIFNPLKVRYTSIKLGLRSEASIRFEKGLNYEYTRKAINRACYLLEKYASGEVLKDSILHDVVDKTPKIAELPIKKAEELLGIPLSSEIINDVFEKLEFPYELNNDIYKVTIPNRCMDINIPEDLIEEIGRIYGYDKLNNYFELKITAPGGYSKETKFRKDISKRLRSLGINEVKNYTLISPEAASVFKDREQVKLLLPFSNDKSIIRTSLISSLIKTYEYNKARNINNINIYEISNVYDKTYQEETKLAILLSDEYIVKNWENKSIKVDFYVLKGILENIVNYLGLANRTTYEIANIEELHSGISAEILVDNENIGFLGKINPKLNKNDLFVLEISLSKLFTKKTGKLKYPEISKYPEIIKDVAFILEQNIKAADVIKEIKKSGGKLLTNINIFDLYKGSNIDENKKSLAFSLTFSNLEKTLTEEEVDVLFRNIIKKVNEKFKSEIRDS